MNKVDLDWGCLCTRCNQIARFMVGKDNNETWRFSCGDCVKILRREGDNIYRIADLKKVD
jgi:hypothetical protein